VEFVAQLIYGLDMHCLLNYTVYGGSSVMLYDIDIFHPIQKRMRNGDQTRNPTEDSISLRVHPFV